MKLKLVKELHQLLERVPKLVDLYEAKQAGFVSAVRDWILESEETLSAFGFSQVAELAGLRGFLAAAEDGIFEASFNTTEHMPRYRARAAVGVQTLDRAAKLLQGILEPEVKKLEEAERILKQALVMSGPKEPATTKEAKKKKTKTNSEEIWEHLWDREDTRTLMRHLLTFVSYDDARELSNHVASGYSAMNQ